MGKQKVLSSGLNMSWGYTPVILSIVLCSFTTPQTAIYIGSGAGLLFSLLTKCRKGAYIPHFILYGTTGMLWLLSAATLLPAVYYPEVWLPFTMEICAVLPPFVLYLNRNRLIKHRTPQDSLKCDKRFFSIGVETAIVSARVLLLFVALHLLAILCAALISHPMGEDVWHALFVMAPPCVFILAIVFNQLGIHYCNRLIEGTTFIPVVNLKGDVIGKVPEGNITDRKCHHLHPVIRIHVASHGMLFLKSRQPCALFEAGKTDTPMETYLWYGETLEQGADRLLRQTLPTAPRQDLHFNLVYHFENETTNRLIYLFLLEVENDTLLSGKEVSGGKIWTFRQIEDNLDKGFFSCCFEHEYEHLKQIIYTRERYKES